MIIVLLFSSIQNGKTALDKAKEYNNSEVVALLEGQLIFNQLLITQLSHICSWLFVKYEMIIYYNLKY